MVERNSAFPRLLNRELGMGCHDRRAPGLWSDVPRHFYESFKKVSDWNRDNQPGYTKKHGAIFNFGFCPDGSKMIASTDYNSMLLFDSHNKRLVKEHTQAHENCVNYSQFFTDTLAASCGDDATVRLWDIRRFSAPLAILHGHSRWVKNVDYYNGKAISSSFDGTILCHDISTANLEEPTAGEQTLLAFDDQMMRSTVHPQVNKLIWSSKVGYMVVIHDLDLDTLGDDLDGFTPAITLLRRACGAEVASELPDFTHLMDPKRRKNRVEILTDFHHDNNCEKVSSLEFHPSGIGVASRNVGESGIEFTSFHDLSDVPAKKDSDSEGGESAMDTGPDDNDEAIVDGDQSISMGGPKRLKYFIEEPKLRRGYIKEPSFSCDGRVLASPYGTRVRLLSFDPACSRPTETESWRGKPNAVNFTVIDQLMVSGDGFVGAVLASQFAPTDPSFLVVGTDGGQVCFFQMAL